MLLADQILRDKAVNASGGKLGAIKRC